MFYCGVETYHGNLYYSLRSDVEEGRREEREREMEDERAAEEDDPGNEMTGPTKVESVDFKAKTNAVDHKCEKYELVQMKKATPVLRRGGNFTIELKLNREVDLKKGHGMKLYFTFGNNPNVHKGTLGIILVTGKVMFDKSHEDWDARVVQNDGKLLTLEVQIPSSAPVGIWNLAVELKPRDPNADHSARQLHRPETKIYILFNPWNKHDTTYMPEDELREEYVLNHVGKIWQGAQGSNQPRGRHWVYGQFDDAVLPACVMLLERSGLRHEARGDPVLVSRAISKIVNSKDDNGVIKGKWRKPYRDGTPPSQWTGSIEILEEYVRRRKPVKYGQCWVFAGVTTTVCRALGLPSRPVTNFSSAHDTDISFTIDEYIDAKGDKITPSRSTGLDPSGVYDAIWNYHVWNDVWMDRPDLPPGYGGWQAIDATPQETSGGVSQCGPASHVAIRRGQTEHKYDVPFVLAAVNADVLHWQEDPDAPEGFKKLYSNKNRVGKRILTKCVAHLEDSGYGGDHEDCTNLYKPPEGTEEERVALHTAARRSRNARHAFRLPSAVDEDVNFSIEDIDRIPIGQDFTMTLKMHNASDEVRTVTADMQAGSTYYTGGNAKLIRQDSGEFTLQPGESRTLSLPVSYQQYYHKLVEHAMVKMRAYCRVKETSFAWVGDECFEVAKPDLLVQAMDKASVRRRFRVRFSFTNPLPRDLHECVLVVDGPGIIRPKTVDISDVPAGKEMMWEYRIVPRKAGSFVLVATFNSVELQNLTGSVQIKVEE